jgi:hypothetical protein
VLRHPRAAIAMPTLVATPWPSGPVVVSTPEVQRYSGWPGHLLSSWRKRLMSSSVTDSSQLLVLFDRLDAGQMQHRVEQHRGVADGQHEAVAVRPDGIVRIEAQMKFCHRCRSTGAIAIGVPGWPELACCTASMHSVRMVLMRLILQRII